jgi:hypothetical protein
MRRIRRFFQMITVCSLVTPWAQTATLSDLASTADSIVVGLVSSRQENENNVEFSIAVEKVLKGETSASVHIIHQRIRPGISIGSPASARIDTPLHGIWFLKQTEAGGWDILEISRLVLFWSTPSVLPPFYQSLATDSLVDRLVLLAAAGIEVQGAQPERLIGATGSSNTRALKAVFLRFTQAQSTPFRSAGLAGMLWGSQSGSIGQLVRLWPMIQHERGATDVIRALRDAFRDPSPDTVIQLGQFAAEIEGASPELHHAAIRALSAIHTKESLSFLAPLLESADTDDQGRAVYAMGSFANGCPAQTLENTKSLEFLQFKNPSPYRNSATIQNFGFRGGPADQESRLVAFWKTWWNQHPELH